MISSVVFACKFKWVTILIHLFLWLSYSYWLYWANYCPHAVWHCLFSIKLVCWVQRLSNMQVFLFHLVQGRNWFLCPCSLISPLMVKLVLCELHPRCLLHALFFLLLWTITNTLFIPYHDLWFRGRILPETRSSQNTFRFIGEWWILIFKASDTSILWDVACTEFQSLRK